MRTIFVLFLMSGCAAATPEIVYIERPARVQAAPTRTSEPTDADPHGLSITYQGDAEHRLIRLQSLSPGVTRIEGVSDRSTWPMVSVRYRVLPGTRTVYFQATSSFPGLQETVACRRHFSTLTVWYGGEPVGTSERLANAGCLLEIILPLRTSFPPPTTSNGRGMWGTRSGPPVPALDDTLP